MMMASLDSLVKIFTFRDKAYFSFGSKVHLKPSQWALSEL